MRLRLTRLGSGVFLLRVDHWPTARVGRGGAFL